jgi:hypothetical protein
LLVIGVSDEEESKIEKTFIDDLGAKYPMVKINKSDTQKYGIKFYPSVYCIAPDGTVHSVPDDRMPSESVIKELLQNVSLAPKLPDESRYAPVRSMWEGKKYKKLDAYLTKMLGADTLDAEMRTVFEAQRKEFDKRAAKQVARVGKAGQGPDYFAAKIKLQKIQKEWANFEAADAAKTELARFSKDSKIKKELAASKSLKKLQRKYDPSKISQRRKLKDALRKFAAKHAGTHAGEQASKQVGRLR